MINFAITIKEISRRLTAPSETRPIDSESDGTRWTPLDPLLASPTVVSLEDGSSKCAALEHFCFAISIE